jgi:hypothetical protein
MLLLLLAFSVLTGCQSMKPDFGKAMIDKLPSLSKEEDPLAGQYKTPAKIVAIWSDAVYTEPGKPPTRGFGGRVYFYDRDHDPVPVQGQFVVYGYDDSIQGKPASEPARKFQFKEEHLANHYTPSELGPSYSFWLPWDPVGGEKKTITLLPMLVDASGQVVRADQSINILPGRAPKDSGKAKESHYRETTPAQMSAVQPVSFERETFGPGGWKLATNQHDSAMGASQQSMHTTTINLPMSTQQRLMQTPADGPEQLPIVAGVPRSRLAAGDPQAQQRSVHSAPSRPQVPVSSSWPATGGHLPSRPGPSAPPSGRPSEPGLLPSGVPSEYVPGGPGSVR